MTVPLQHFFCGLIDEVRFSKVVRYRGILSRCRWMARFAGFGHAGSITLMRGRGRWRWIELRGRWYDDRLIAYMKERTEQALQSGRTRC